MTNPKLLPWFEIGMRRFAESGLTGLNIVQMSEEAGIAKTSFYHFFGTKEQFLTELFEHWVAVGTLDTAKHAMVHEDPFDGFKTIMRLALTEKYIPEKFWLQVGRIDPKLTGASKYVDEVNRFRQSVVSGLFARGGISPREAEWRARQVVTHFKGIMQEHFREPPSNEQIEEHLQDFIRLFWPEKME